MVFRKPIQIGGEKYHKAGDPKATENELRRAGGGEWHSSEVIHQRGFYVQYRSL